MPHAVHLAISRVQQHIENIRRQNLVIALDGHSSSGKSTLAHDLAYILHLLHIDTGAMYRAVTLYVLEQNIDPHDHNHIGSILDDVKISFERDQEKCNTILNGANVETHIRSMKVSNNVSQISTISAVRKHLVSLQRKMAQNNGVVMDGRDIGTVVLPHADVKIFVSADIEVRAQRRYDELKSKGSHITRDEVRHNLAQRDYMDSSRADSPLIQAQDAQLLDTGALDRGQMVAAAIDMIYQRISQ